MQKPADLPELDHPTLDADSIRRSLYNRLVYTIGEHRRLSLGQHPSMDRSPGRV